MEGAKQSLKSCRLWVSCMDNKMKAALKAVRIAKQVHMSHQSKNYKMKKEEITPIALQIKALAKKCRCYNRQSIRIIHEFCEYEMRRTIKVLTMAEELKNPISLIESLIKRPEQSEEILNEMERKFDKLYGMDVQLETSELPEEHVMSQGKAIVQLGYNFFEDVPEDCVLSIMSFLDPYSFQRFSWSSRQHHLIGNSSAQSEYYKRLCTKLFRLQPPPLPNHCRFQKIKDYVLAHPIEYKPNTRNAVQNNLRRYIWKREFNQLQVQPSYYKSYGSYQNLFKHCPRLNLNGYYVCRDKYVRIGQKNDKNPVTPIHVNYFYRYFRFLEDGSCLYHVCTRKLKHQQISQLLARSLVQDDAQKETMIGQYVQYKGLVMIRAVQQHEVFSYEMKIESPEGAINNELMVLKYTLELIDDSQEIFQTLFKATPKKEGLSFHYYPHSELAIENSPAIQASCL